MRRLFPANPTRWQLTDGAWGTEFLARHPGAQPPFEMWNLLQPDRVLEVGLDYAQAGSQIILTNTFRANRLALPELDAPTLRRVNERGVELSRLAVGPEGCVVGSIGPLGIAFEQVDPRAAAGVFREQAKALAGAGCDALVLETLTDLREARLAVSIVCETDCPVIASFHFASGKGGPVLASGEGPGEVARAMRDAGAQAVGANCGATLEPFLTICEAMRQSADLPVWIKPNAGLPARQGDRFVYPVDPAAFAQFTLRLIAAGAAFVGGCCGTTPAHIAAIRCAAGNAEPSRD